MNGTLFTVLVSGMLSVVAALGAVALTQYLGRKRDHEADWRKMKLEHYKEYIAALSRVVGRDLDANAQRRYADAANSLTLVAPSDVLTALYSFQDGISYSNQSRDSTRNELMLSLLLRNMREDCHPKAPKDKAEFLFRMLDVPPGYQDERGG